MSRRERKSGVALEVRKRGIEWKWVKMFLTGAHVLVVNR